MVQAVVFDVNETLFALDPIRDRMAAVGLPAGTMERWFKAILVDGIGAAAAGTFAPFPDLARHHLSLELSAHGILVDAGHEDNVLAGFEDVVPHPDVDAALQGLAAAGVTACTLTNGTASVTHSMLERAGLDGLVQHVWDVSRAGMWKPRPEAYHWAVAQLGLDPASVALVAVHPWDVHGAGEAGLVAGWLDRAETGRYPAPPLREPDVTGPSLDGIVQQILG